MFGGILMLIDSLWGAIAALPLDWTTASISLTTDAQ
jgi:hypothetical protein